MVLFWLFIWVHYFEMHNILKYKLSSVCVFHLNSRCGTCVAVCAILLKKQNRIALIFSSFPNRCVTIFFTPTVFPSVRPDAQRMFLAACRTDSATATRTCGNRNLVASVCATPAPSCVTILSARSLRTAPNPRSHSESVAPSVLLTSLHPLVVIYLSRTSHK